jgi:hypothetical protein
MILVVVNSKAEILEEVLLYWLKIDKLTVKQRDLDSFSNT